MADMISARGLVKRYKSVVALAGLDLDVPEGEVLALLGPNGAGKTTAVRCLTTLLVPDEGTATVAGVDVLDDPQGVRRRIGLSGQYAAVDENLTGYENLTMVGRLYGMRKARAAQRARELLERFDLADAGDRPSKTYSGGMRRRLDLAGALVAAPPVLVLDEPTTGLDVRSRQQMWDVIRELVGGGATLLLTTQYLEEADRLADDILVIDHGRAIARGTADELKAQTGGERVEVVVADRRVVEPSSGCSRRWRWARSRPRTARSPPRSATAPTRCGGCSTRSTPPRSPCSTSACGAPRSTTSSSPSPGTRPRRPRTP